MGQEDAPAAEHGSDTKLAEAILYVSSRLAEVGDRYRGAVKLNKILWWADFESFRRNGNPVTGATYQRLPEGPAPVRLLPVRGRLESDGDAHRESFDSGAPRREDVLVADRPARDDVLTSSDRQALDEAIERFLGMPGSQVSELSHRESAGWQAVKNGEIIPYETALIATTTIEFPPGTQARIEALLQAHEASTGSASR